jgi:ABC-type transport system involved in multi-copper enzyme maturation permease subunit
MNPASTFSPARVTPNLAHAWGGIWRLTFRRLLLPAHWLSLAIGIAVLLLLEFAGIKSGDQFDEWATGFYVTFLLPALAFMAGGGVMREEMKSSNVDYVLTRPIPRPAFVIFKFVAHTICLQINFLITLAAVVIFAATSQQPGLAALLPKVLLGQVLMLTAFSAFGFLCGAITARYIVIGLAYAAIIEAGVGQIPTQLSRLSMTHQMRDFLKFLMGRTEELTSLPSWGGTLGMMAAFCVVMLAATVAIFSFRELSGPADS